jgi:hypothetical protein
LQERDNRSLSLPRMAAVVLSARIFGLSHNGS